MKKTLLILLLALLSRRQQANSDPCPFAPADPAPTQE